ncbi:MAG: hypothetical protein BA871_08675 [Desulfuromonadales bacterium C00003096]|nr:MAG: hypothetical protein BA871_08675 [Desulfuromonadales bacterium C00003096]
MYLLSQAVKAQPVKPRGRAIRTRKKISGNEFIFYREAAFPESVLTGPMKGLFQQSKIAKIRLILRIPANLVKTFLQLQN